MRAVRFTTPGTPLIDAEVEPPELLAGHVLVQVGAAGICHSDAHYRAGRPAPSAPPVTLGHETAGTIIAVAEGGPAGRIGEKVAVHYVVSCGACAACLRDREQFCDSYEMIGNTIDGGYAELLAVPERNAIRIPDSVPLEQAAVMMCSTVTALHALNRGRLTRGESVAVFGAGGLGQSAIRLAVARGAATVFAVDIDAGRVASAAEAGARGVLSPQSDPVATIAATGGVDVAIDMVGSGTVMRQAIDVLRPGGRAVAVGITADTLRIAPYGELIARELEVIGANDHSRTEAAEVLEMAGGRSIDIAPVVTETIPLEALRINEVLDRLDAFGPGMRTVILPGR